MVNETDFTTSPTVLLAAPYLATSARRPQAALGSIAAKKTRMVGGIANLWPSRSPDGPG